MGVRRTRSSDRHFIKGPDEAVSTDNLPTTEESEFEDDDDSEWDNNDGADSSDTVIYIV